MGCALCMQWGPCSFTLPVVWWVFGEAKGMIEDEGSFYIWGVLCQKQVSRAGISNNISQNCGMWLLLPALDKCLLHTSLQIITWTTFKLISPRAMREISFNEFIENLGWQCLSETKICILYGRSFLYFLLTGIQCQGEEVLCDNEIFLNNESYLFLFMTKILQFIITIFIRTVLLKKINLD